MNGSQNALEVMQKKVGDLIVRAPVDGQLLHWMRKSANLKIKDERLGQIDVLSGFKVRVDIDEHYISRIYYRFARRIHICQIKIIN